MILRPLSILRLLVTWSAVGTLIALAWLALGPDDVDRAAAQAPTQRIMLPLAVQGADLARLPLPPTAPPPPTATATPDATATPAATATATPLPTPTPFICGDMPGRLVTRKLDLDGHQVRSPGRNSPHWTTFPVMSVARGSGLLVGWSDTEETVHITGLDEDGQRERADWTVQGMEIRGLVAHADGGAALLVVRPPSMFLIRLDAEGEVVWETQLFGQNGEIAGSKFIMSWPRESRLLWDGRMYAAYVGHTENKGGQGTHQGDLLWFFDAQGNKGNHPEHTGWDWGCSHSLDLRLAHDGVRLGPVCLSDAYPRKAILFNHDELTIRREPTGDESGGSEARLGGWVPIRRNGFLLSFASPTGRPGSMRDIGLAHVGNDQPATLRSLTWLTETEDVAEDSPHLAAYGRAYLAGWQSGDEFVLAEVDPLGTITEGPAAVDAWIQPKDDFATVAGGHVMWAAPSADRTALEIHRVRYCQRP